MRNSKIEICGSQFGKGLFACEDIRPGTILCKVTGARKELSLYETTLLGDKESHTIQVDFDRYLFCEPPFLYSNHSCNPNCGVNENLQLFALHPIAAGNELLWDYSTSMLERNWTMKCNCGQHNCRKIVTDFDLLPAELQWFYLEKKMVMPFIAQFIKYRRARIA